MTLLIGGYLKLVIRKLLDLTLLIRKSLLGVKVNFFVGDFNIVVDTRNRFVIIFRNVQRVDLSLKVAVTTTAGTSLLL